MCPCILAASSFHHKISDRRVHRTMENGGIPQLMSWFPDAPDGGNGVVAGPYEDIP